MRQDITNPPATWYSS